MPVEVVTPVYWERKLIRSIEVLYTSMEYGKNFQVTRKTDRSDRISLSVHASYEDDG
jgi:hypothetical protein